MHFSKYNKLNWEFGDFFVFSSVLILLLGLVDLKSRRQGFLLVFFPLPNIIPEYLVLKNICWKLDKIIISVTSSSKKTCNKINLYWWQYGKNAQDLSFLVSYLAFPNQSFLTCNEVNNNTNTKRWMYKSFVLKSSPLSFLFVLIIDSHWRGESKDDGTTKGKQLPCGIIEVKMAVEAQWSNWSPGEMGSGVGEKYPHSVGVREYVLGRNHSWKIMI